MTHKPKDFIVNQKGVGVGSEEKIMVLTLPSTFWGREPLAWSLYPWSLVTSSRDGHTHVFNLRGNSLC